MSSNRVWQTQAVALLRAFLAQRPRLTPFSCQDVSAFALQRDFPEPSHPRAWGGVMLRARREGVIRKTGVAMVERRNENSNPTYASMWAGA